MGIDMLWFHSMHITPTVPASRMQEFWVVRESKRIADRDEDIAEYM
jgi:hypothetical protein